MDTYLSKDLSKIIGQVIHSVNNSIMAISLSANNLASEYQLSKEDRADMLANIKAASKLTQINLLELNLIRQFCQPSVPWDSKRRFDFTPLLNRTLQIFTFIGAQKQLNLKFSCNPSSEVYLLEGNDYHLEIALFSILHNAFRFSPKGSNLFINLEKDPKEIILTVIDEGPGIDPSLLKEAMKPFCNIKNQDRSLGLQKGLGLGLAFTQKTLTSFDGKLVIENNINGVGLSQKLIFPIPSFEQEEEL